MEQTTIIPPSYLPMVVEASEQTTNIGETIIDAEIITEEATATPFIEANSTPITLESLQNDCVIPHRHPVSPRSMHYILTTSPGR